MNRYDMLDRYWIHTQSRCQNSTNISYVKYFVKKILICEHLWKCQRDAVDRTPVIQCSGQGPVPNCATVTRQPSASYLAPCVCSDTDVKYTRSNGQLFDQLLVEQQKCCSLKFIFVACLIVTDTLLNFQSSLSNLPCTLYSGFNLILQHQENEP